MAFLSSFYFLARAAPCIHDGEQRARRRNRSLRARNAVVDQRSGFLGVEAVVTGARLSIEMNPFRNMTTPGVRRDIDLRVFNMKVFFSCRQNL